VLMFTRFSTKYRHQVSGSGHLERIEQITRDVWADFGAKLCKFSGESARALAGDLLANDGPSLAWSAASKGCPRAFTAGVPRRAPLLQAGQAHVV